MSTILFPNQMPGTSEIWNDPQYAPLLGVPDGMELPIGTVSEEANIGNDAFNYLATPQGPMNMLMRLRHEFPYLPIFPIPSWNKTILTTAGNPIDLDVPVGVVMIMFQSSGVWLMSNKGNAQLPVAGDGNGSDSLYRPDNIAFYTSNCRQLSIISPAATIVSAWGYRFEELPR